MIKSKGHFIPSLYFHLNGSIKIEIEAVSTDHSYTPNQTIVTVKIHLFTLQRENIFSFSYEKYLWSILYLINKVWDSFKKKNTIFTVEAVKRKYTMIQWHNIQGILNVLGCGHSNENHLGTLAALFSWALQTRAANEPSVKLYNHWL